jgi:hypothetical protein
MKAKFSFVVRNRQKLDPGAWAKRLGEMVSAAIVGRHFAKHTGNKVLTQKRAAAPSLQRPKPE